MKLETKYIAPAIRISAVVLAIAGIILLYQSTAKNYLIFDGDVEYSVHSHSSQVEAILNQAGIDIGLDDLIIPNLDQKITDGSAITIQRGQPFLLSSGEEYIQVSAVGGSVSELIQGAGERLYPGDRIWIDGIPFSDLARIFQSPPQTIRYQKSNSIQLNIDGEEISLHTTAPTLGEALTEAGFHLRIGDELVPGPETPTVELGQAMLSKAIPITVHADGSTVTTWVVAEDVGTALSKAGTALIGNDYSIPDLEDNLPQDGEIRVVRVDEQVVIEQEPIPFETGYQPSPDLEIDQQTIVETGSYGVRARRIRISFEDGDEVSRTTEGEWVAREPEQRVVGYGTNLVIRSMDTPHGTINYWRAIRMYATSYSPSRAGVPDDWPWFGQTACGKTLVKGLVAIDNRYIPFHTMMYVPGYGFAEACDIGGGVKGRWIDLGYEDHNWESWHEYVTVYFLTPIPPANSIAWIFP
jgi:uncharacterized protein YabE (DUF348 family)